MFVKFLLRDEMSSHRSGATKARIEIEMKIVEEHPHRRRMDQPGADSAILQSLERYWQALRHAQRIPSRNDIEPSQIDRALPHAFILQRVAPGIARMRVAGQQLHDLLKMDARGMPISTFFLPDARDQIAELIEAAFTEPAIISVPLTSPGGLMRSDLTGTMLMLPLRDDKGETSRILGAIVTEGQTGSRPRRFEITGGAPIRHQSLGLQLASVQSIPRPAKEKGPDVARPALRLVVNNG